MLEALKKLVMIMSVNLLDFLSQPGKNHYSAEYYYKNDGCLAKDPGDPDCICWRHISDQEYYFGYNSVRIKAEGIWTGEVKYTYINRVEK